MEWPPLWNMQLLKENFLFIFKLLTATHRCLELGKQNKNFAPYEMRFRNHIEF